MNEEKQKQFNAIAERINSLKNEEDIHDYTASIMYAIDDCFTHTDEALQLAEMYTKKCDEIRDMEADKFFKELVDNEFKTKTAEILGNPVETYNEVNLSSLTVDELKHHLSKHLEETLKEYNKLLDSYKTMKPGEDGWYYMGYVEDEYEILEPYAEKAGMLKEFKEVYDKFWPLEHMTYEDVQKLISNK